MAEEPVIRPARPEDVAAIESLVEAAYTPHVARVGGRPKPMDDDYAGRVDRGEAFVIGDPIEAALVVVDGPDWLRIDNIAVAPAAQRRGLGGRLLAHAEENARALGRHEVRLLTGAALTENRAWYGRHGYAEFLPEDAPATTRVVWLRKQLEPRPDPIRLNRYLAAAGLGSRRAVEDLIAGGLVAINGEVERSLGRRVSATDTVVVDGDVVRPEAHVVVLLHKPAGVVTTAHDPDERPTVVGLVRDHRRLFPVGRLDAATTGALLLTNDGDLANRLMHPRHGVTKVYEALVAGRVGDEALRTLRDGVPLDGRPTAPANVRIVTREDRRTLLELELHEGRNRQVRRMCDAVGHPVRALHRPRYAGLTLAGLAPGEWRELRPHEVERLRDAGN